MVANEPADGRVASRARNRGAILTAAAGLMYQRRTADFSVDDLAAAAGVSRRTIFNHFASLEDVVTEVAGDLLGEIVDRMEAHASGVHREPATITGYLAATAAADHLVPTIAYLLEIFDDYPRGSTREAVLMQRAFSLFTQRMTTAIAHRHPGVRTPKAELLVAAFGGGVLGLVDQWIEATGGIDTAESRRAWDDLIAALTAVLREPGH